MWEWEKEVRIRSEARPWFQAAVLEESSMEISNPGRGWYHIYTFPAKPPEDGRPVDGEVWLDDACRRETLALALVDMGCCRSCELPPEVLEHLERILQFFRKERKQVILRPAYDIRGDGMVREPYERGLVKRHLEQIGAVLSRHAEDILVVQGLLVGSWGEMHGSRHLNPESLRELAETLDGAAKGACFLSVRTPEQWRQVTGGRTCVRELRGRLGLYNDGIFGSPTDMGTYGGLEREKELIWQKRHLAGTPNGGEVLFCAPPAGYEEADRVFRMMHLSYLNSIWQQAQLNVWRGQTVRGRGCWDGVSGFDYIGRHLGYRFVVRGVRALPGRKLRITVENCGYADFSQETDGYLILVPKGTEGPPVRVRVSADAGNWRCGQKARFVTGLSEENVRMGRTEVYLRLELRSDRTPVRFANRGAGEQVLLGEIGQ